MATLLEYFKTDFAQYPCSDREISAARVDVSGNLVDSTPILLKSIVDMESSVKTFIFYIPELPVNFSVSNVIKSIFAALDVLIQEDRGVQIFSNYENDLTLGLFTSVYSKRLFVYSEAPTEADEVDEIHELALNYGYQIIVRSQGYIETRMKNSTPAAFISHDSRNKDLIARPLANGLDIRLCTVWYDEFSLKVGDSLRLSIEKGIKEAKKYILIITPEFLSNPGWGRKEFDSIFTREMVTGERVVIPIWLGVTKIQVYDYSPSLADTMALIWPDPTQERDAYDKAVAELISKVHAAVS
jgi:hypothetical protein